MVERNLKSDSLKCSSVEAYKIGRMEQLLGWGSLLIMVVILAWEFSDIRTAHYDMHKLRILFLSNPLVSGVLALALVAAGWIPAAFIFAFLKQQVRRKTVAGTLDAAEIIESRKRHRSLSLVVSGAEYVVCYEESLEKYISCNSLVGKHVRLDLRGGDRVYALSVDEKI